MSRIGRLLFRWRLARAAKRSDRAKRDFDRVKASAADELVARDAECIAATKALGALEIEAARRTSLQNARVLMTAGGLAAALPKPRGE